MKKLMIAATAAVAGATAFGGLCDPEAVSDSCSVYNIKFTFKTIAAKTACAQGAKWLVSDTLPGAAGVWGAKWYRNAAADKEASAIATAAGRSVEAADYVTAGAAGGPSGRNFTVCADGTLGQIFNADHRQVYWMDNATRKFEGVAWQCAAACFEGIFFDCDLTNNGRLNYVIWEKKNSLAISYPVFQVKYGPDADANGQFDNPAGVETSYFSLDAQRSMLIGRYGKKAQKVAAFWAPRLLHGQAIFAAGFGTYDVKNLRTKSVSGNATGMIMPVDEGTDPCGKAKIFCALGFMCVEWVDWCCDGCYAGVDLVPASGTWSLKYNASATKKANKDKATLASFVPAYMFYSHSAWADARAVDPWLHTDNYYWWNSDPANLGLIYKEGGAAAGLTDDEALDHIANNACLVIDIVFDGVYDSVNKTYTYGSTEPIALDESGNLPTDLFPAKPAEEEQP